MNQLSVKNEKVNSEAISQEDAEIVKMIDLLEHFDLLSDIDVIEELEPNEELEALDEKR